MCRVTLRFIGCPRVLKVPWWSSKRSLAVVTISDSYIQCWCSPGTACEYRSIANEKWGFLSSNTLKEAIVWFCASKTSIQFISGNQILLSVGQKLPSDREWKISMNLLINPEQLWAREIIKLLLKRLPDHRQTAQIITSANICCSYFPSEIFENICISENPDSFLNVSFSL